MKAYAVEYEYKKDGDKVGNQVGEFMILGFCTIDKFVTWFEVQHPDAELTSFTVAVNP